MNSCLKIYWLTRLDNINDFFTGMAITSIVLIIGIKIYDFACQDFDNFYKDEEIKNRKDSRKKTVSKLNYLIITGIIGLITIIFLPTKNEAILILAGGKTIDFIKNDSSIKKIPQQTTLIISSFLDKQIKDLKK